MSNQKKIFLSHKGKDKQLVRDFKKTLETIGYQPWLDEDAMPAGTSLERGILQGMKDSCAVVFFITPSFEDEGFLESEINYAIAEKRSKKDKFSIITLQFVDDSGKKGLIPDLLKPYVWKTPENNLEALREIIRALPIIPSDFAWQKEIEDIVTEPEIKYNSINFSKEVQEVIRETVHDRNGSIDYCDDPSGSFLNTNGKSFITDLKPRTLSKWRAIMNELIDNKLVEKVNDQGWFRLTDKGYKAADNIKNNSVQ